MITPPRRSVTRFFIPLIDVLILLFCIFLLMPFVSTPAEPEPEPEAKAPVPAQKLPDTTKQLQRELTEARLRIERLERARARQLEGLTGRVLDIDPGVDRSGEPVKDYKPRLIYYAGSDEQLIDSEAKAIEYITRQKAQAGSDGVFFTIRYPPFKSRSGHPTGDERKVYERWFKDVPHTFDTGS